MAAPQVLIVGAGVTGSMLALLLKDAGLRVQVLEKSRVAGGRMMTVSHRLGGRDAPVLARADLGAQYISTRSAPDHPELSPVYGRLLDEGLLAPFTGEIAGPNPYGAAAGAEARPPPSGVAEVRHYAAPEGLRALSEHFVKASGVPVEFGVAVEELSLDDGGKLTVKVSGSEAPLELAEKSAVVLTQPVQQVLGQSKFPVKGNFLEKADASVVAALEKVQYSSRYAMAFYFESPDFSWPYTWAASYFQSGDVRYVACDTRKRGAKGEPALSVVVHSGVPLGIEYLDDEEPFAAPQERLLKDLAGKLPEVPWAEASASKVHKWRYSQVYKGYDGSAPAPSWVWNCTEDAPGEAMPGHVTLFGKDGPALGLVSGDAVAPSSNFEGCIYAASKTSEALKAYFSETCQKL
eukprot:TRINITY_DN29469_c0_g1_i1.p1 TRINITY_DN29469_c0_g1~~TRINITY_DN29469_c0_g1_i1.p1  ORF type:complete len:450 (+),score=59.43 TRINITY_DN29469_c0_g1_i1:133-1350(+)